MLMEDEPIQLLDGKHPYSKPRTAQRIFYHVVYLMV